MYILLFHYPGAWIRQVSSISLHGPEARGQNVLTGPTYTEIKSGIDPDVSNSKAYASVPSAAALVLTVSQAAWAPALPSFMAAGPGTSHTDPTPSPRPLVTSWRSRVLLRQDCTAEPAERTLQAAAADPAQAAAETKRTPLLTSAYQVKVMGNKHHFLLVGTRAPCKERTLLIPFVTCVPLSIPTAKWLRPGAPHLHWATPWPC